MANSLDQVQVRCKLDARVRDLAIILGGPSHPAGYQVATPLTIPKKKTRKNKGPKPKKVQEFESEEETEADSDFGILSVLVT